MGKETIVDKLKAFIASISFKLFLFMVGLTEEEYLNILWSIPCPHCGLIFNEEVKE